MAREMIQGGRDLKKGWLISPFILSFYALFYGVLHRDQRVPGVKGTVSAVFLAMYQSFFDESKWKRRKSAITARKTVMQSLQISSVGVKPFRFFVLKSSTLPKYS